MAETPETPEIPYEQARDELISVVQKLEVGGTSLDESLALWERGELLAGDLPAVARRCPQPARRGGRDHGRSTPLIEIASAPRGL